MNFNSFGGFQKIWGMKIIWIFLRVITKLGQGYFWGVILNHFSDFSLGQGTEWDFFFGWGGPRGGGTLIFSSYIGSDPASTVHPKKISGISSTPKNI